MSDPDPEPVLISVVTPVYKAADCLAELHSRLVKELEAITPNFEIVMIEDCGGDRSWEVISELAAKDPRVRGYQLSRNFGQHYAIAAGLDAARGEWVAIMDCDLQDAPEEIGRLYAEAQKGFEVVLARRAQRKDSLGKRLTSRLFYLIFNYLTGVKFDRGVAGFCLLSRGAVDALCSLRESTRFLMAHVHWIGYPTTTIDVEHRPNTKGRESSYTLLKLLRLAFESSLGFSEKPLYAAMTLGFGMSAVSFVAALTVVGLWLNGTLQVVGWPSLMVSIWFTTGLVIATLGIVGVYVGKVFQQVKGRPLYVVRRNTLGAPENANE